MKFKFEITQLLISLIVSPVIFYIIIGIAKLAGATYNISHGDAFIIWLLLAILVRLSISSK
ncbi:MAG: hypothetical protein FJ375_03785 [Pelagibacterales bacterium]|nr:hypothetical protein [Pelagibacterales bacterium]